TTATVQVHACSGTARAEISFELVVTSRRPNEQKSSPSIVRLPSDTHPELDAAKTRQTSATEASSIIKVVQETEVFPVLPAEQPPKPAVSPATAPATADRWMLMKALQGTWAGMALDTERLSISGWTEASFTASSVHDNQLPMGFNYLAN